MKASGATAGKVTIGATCCTPNPWAMVADATDNTRELALNRILSTGLVGSIPHRDMPFFPDANLLVTTLRNLSIYQQKSTLRRFI